jgi:hypothetical protein
MSALITLLRLILKELMIMFISQAFMKELIIYMLEKIHKRTKWKGDDDLLKMAKRAWGVEEKPIYIEDEQKDETKTEAKT